MASEKFLAVIGVDEEDTARIRLSLRAAKDRLQQHWTLSDERSADLVIVDPKNLQGQIARNRAYSGGRHCAVLDADEPLRGGEVRLVAPIDTQALIEVLTGAALSSVDIGQQITQQNHDFYDPGAFEPRFETESEAPDIENAPPQTAKPHAPSLDEMLKISDAAERARFPMPDGTALKTRKEPLAAAAAGTQEPSKASMFAHRDLAGGPEGINLRSFGPTQHADSHRLREIIAKNLLGGPANLQMPGAPELTLDPKARVFYANGPLSALAAYCRQPIAPGQWDPVTTAELTRLRSHCAMRPFDALSWLEALVNSDGHLARQLDPGGRYRLRRPPGFESDFSGHDRILLALDQPRRLNEIAANARVSMSAVFDMINALDAIGLIEVSPRIPRHAEEKSRSPLGWLRDRLRGR